MLEHLVKNKTISREEHTRNSGKLPSETARLQSHKYSIDSDYFKVFSHNMAYIVGFIAADGCIRIRTTKNNNSKSHGTYDLIFNITDREILEFIVKELKAEQPIIERPKSYHCTNGNYDKYKQQYSLYISNKEIIMDLLILGIHPNKAHNILFQDWYPKEFMPDYIRGIIDGDGCWFKSKKGYYRMTLTSSSKLFLQGIGNYLKEELGIIPKIYTDKKTKVNQLYYGGREVAALYYYLYESNKNCFYLKRKYDIIKDITKVFFKGICKRCKKQFVRVAGLQDYCKKCKREIKIQSRLTSDCKMNESHMRSVRSTKAGEYL